MTLDEYQKKAHATAQYPEQGKSILYCALKLSGEAGEFSEKVGKLWRNRGAKNVDDYDAAEKMALAYELADVLWYISEAAQQLGFSLNSIAQANLDKLASRQARGVIKSEGDNR